MPDMRPAATIAVMRRMFPKPRWPTTVRVLHAACRIFAKFLRNSCVVKGRAAGALIPLLHSRFQMSDLCRRPILADLGERECVTPVAKPAGRWAFQEVHLAGERLRVPPLIDGDRMHVATERGTFDEEFGT